MHLDELKKVYLQHNFTELIIGYEENGKGEETANQNYILRNKEETIVLWTHHFDGFA